MHCELATVAVAVTAPDVAYPGGLVNGLMLLWSSLLCGAAVLWMRFCRQEATRRLPTALEAAALGIGLATVFWVASCIALVPPTWRPEPVPLSCVLLTFGLGACAAMTLKAYRSLWQVLASLALCAVLCMASVWLALGTAALLAAGLRQSQQQLALLFVLWGACVASARLVLWAATFSAKNAPMGQGSSAGRAGDSDRAEGQA